MRVMSVYCVIINGIQNSIMDKNSLRYVCKSIVVYTLHDCCHCSICYTTKLLLLLLLLLTGVLAHKYMHINM